MSGRRRPAGGAVALALGALLSVPPAAAQPSGEAPPHQARRFSLNGFAAGGYLISANNDFLSTGSRGGSFDLYEAGVTGSLEITRRLRLAAQVLARRAGVTDDGDPRLDFAFLDYALISGVRTRLGVRAGRVKNPYGLFNETRDVVFTRPGILLPQAVYFEGQGFRELLFSGDGAQLYGDHDTGTGNTSWTISVLDAFDAGERTRRDLLGDAQAAADIRVGDLGFAQVRRSSAQGRWLAALSAVRARIAIASREPPLRISFESEVWILSARHFKEQWSFTGEYALTRTTMPGGPAGTSSEGIYIQADRQWAPRWSSFARLDLRFADRNDRDGAEFERTTGAPAHQRFTRDLTIGVKWAPIPDWGLWAEMHEVDGTGSIRSDVDPKRPPQELARRWRVFLLMVGVRF